MVRLTPPSTPAKSTGSSRSGGFGPGGVSLVHSINSFCAKLTRAAKKIATNSNSGKPMSPKKFFLTLSNKTIVFKQKKKAGRDHDYNHQEFVDDDESENMDFGDEGGLWQRSILLGDKCQPLDFSGVIYYDSNGKQLSEFPMRSPRASPLPSYMFASSEK